MTKGNIMAQRRQAEVVRLFGLEDDDIDQVQVGHTINRQGQASRPAFSAIDLSGKSKAVFGIGLGGTGKTTLMRWAVEQVINAGAEQTSMAALDPENRDLRNYFDGVLEPEGYAPEEVAKWLEDFLAYLMKTKGSALLDMGGGDTSLGTVVAQNPDICQILEDGGVTPVALYMIAPRVESLSPLATMEAADFQPKATALILNDGLEDATVPRDRKFRDVLKHPAFKAALDRGAVQLWMPRLHAAQEVYRRRITFAQARDGIVPEGRRMAPLGLFDRSRVRAWLEAMAVELSPIDSWIPRQ
jgi:hypothetical protein